MSVSAVANRTLGSASADFSPLKTSLNQDHIDQVPNSIPSISTDKYIKYQDNANNPSTYNAKGRLSADPRDYAGLAASLCIMAPQGGMFLPGGPHDDDREMSLILGQISSDEHGYDGKNPPYKKEYDEYSAIFREIYAGVLTERGLMPESGDIHEVKVKVGKIYKVYDEVMAKVRSHPCLAELAASLGIE
jgi:hypothetical protein